MESRWLGCVRYERALEIQTEALQKLQNKLARESDNSELLDSDFGGEVLGLEHFPVITLGKRSDASLDLLIPAAQLEKKGLSLFSVDRGGEATLHSPGQLVIYPVLPLRRLGWGVRKYVEFLTASTQAFLHSVGVCAERATNEPGLYVQGQKIAFFGIRVHAGITQHGISINVVNNLGLFSSIRSCGHSNERFTSLHSLGCQLSTQEAFEQWMHFFNKACGHYEGKGDAPAQPHGALAPTRTGDPYHVKVVL